MVKVLKMLYVADIRLIFITYNVVDEITVMHIKLFAIEYYERCFYTYNCVNLRLYRNYILINIVY